MNIHKLIDVDLKQLYRNAALCGAPVGGGSINALGTPAPAEALTLTLALGVFVGAGVWMFRRWGGSPGANEPSGASPEVATEAREERELVHR
ncbi:MAG TPA: hypothetical protein VGR18_15105 [Rubrobacter sp.]|nr:hypothetical protein [Rubrobacter sp.]